MEEQSKLAERILDQVPTLSSVPTTRELQGRPTLTRALHKSGRRLYVEMSFAIVKDDTENETLGAVAVARPG
jgi:hypothetical protein